MPKNQETNTKMSSKYGNKSTFSRDKKYADSSADIEHNAENVNKYKEMRDQERRYNLEVANGQEPRQKTEPRAKSEPVAKSEPMAKPDKPIIRCACGTPGLFAWFSPEGEKLILCDECYADRE
jgi:hypothetical protein